MGKKNGSEEQSTVENRVYLFKDLAAAFVAEQSDLLTGTDPQRQSALRALSDIAHACCVMADSAGLDEDEVAHLIKTGPVAPVVEDSDVVLESRTAAATAGGEKKGGGKKKGGKKKGGKKKGNGGDSAVHADLPGRRGWGGGHGGG